MLPPGGQAGETQTQAREHQRRRFRRTTCMAITTVTRRHLYKSCDAASVTGCRRTGRREADQADRVLVAVGRRPRIAGRAGEMIGDVGIRRREVTAELAGERHRIAGA